MSWIESHQSLSRHRKTLRATALLRVNRYQLIGHLHELWWWALDNVPTDGSLAGLSAEEIAEGAGWPIEDAERFVEALTAAGFIDRQPQALHDWYEYAGKLNDRRDRERQRSRTRRDQQRPPDTDAPDQQDTGNDRATTAGQPRNVARDSGGTVPNLTGPNLEDADASSLGAQPPPPKRQRQPRHVITADEIEAIVAEYADRLGGALAARDEIDAALNHTARLKAFDERLYVRRWLTRSIQLAMERSATRGKVVHLNGHTAADEAAQLEKWGHLVG